MKINESVQMPMGSGKDCNLLTGKKGWIGVEDAAQMQIQMKQIWIAM
jgi:hypothetical protein